jgi:hypothetical protein
MKIFVLSKKYREHNNTLQARLTEYFVLWHFCVQRMSVSTYKLPCEAINILWQDYDLFHGDLTLRLFIALDVSWSRLWHFLYTRYNDYVTMTQFLKVNYGISFILV